MSEQYEPVYGDWQLGNNTKLPAHHRAAAVKAIATHHGHAINVNCQCVIPCAVCEHVLSVEEMSRRQRPCLRSSALVLISLICDLGISAALWMPSRSAIHFNIPWLNCIVQLSTMTKCIRRRKRD